MKHADIISHKVPALDIENLSVGYGKTVILKEITVKVDQHEIVGLIGVNGAGKTTTIKSILGLRRAIKGSISVFGDKVGAVATNRHIAYLPEKFEPPSFLTGAEFLKFSLRLYGAIDAAHDFESSAERLYLDPAALKRRVSTYSKGMRQKLGLLATFLTPCPLLILDEPMSGLDPRARALVKQMIKEESAKRTIFFSSHILADMEELCSRVLIVHDGIVRAIDKPATICEKTHSNSLEQAFLHFIERGKVA